MFYLGGMETILRNHYSYFYSGPWEKESPVSRDGYQEILADFASVTLLKICVFNIV